MEPPICAICDERFDPGDGGGRVRFVETEAGRTFARRVAEDGITGDPPDEAWCCRRHLAPAHERSTTHTLAAAVAELRPAAPAGPSEPARPVDPGPETPGLAEALARHEERLRTRRDHRLDDLPREVVAEELRRTRDDVLQRLGLDQLEPEVERQSSTSKGPEWREAATATSVEIREAWRSDEHEVVYRDRDIVWDSWSGMPRGGDLMQGTLSLAIDDTRLYASYGAEGTVAELTEYGSRTPAAADAIDDLLRRLRSG